VTVLKRIVRAAKGETAVVLWTKHEEDEPVFKAALGEHWPDFEPAFSMRLSDKLRFVHADDELEQVAAELATKASDETASSGATSGDKPAAQVAEASEKAASLGGAASTDDTKNGPVDTADRATTAPIPAAEPAARPAAFGVEELRNRISDSLNDEGYRLLWEWEQSIHDAASATVAMLLQMRANRTDIALMTVLAKLAQAPGQKIDDVRSALAGLFEGLNPVHADYVRRLAHEYDPGSHAKALLELLQSGKLAALPQPDLALLNRFMLADMGRAGAPYPGDVFLAREWQGEFPGGAAEETRKRLLVELFKEWKADDPRFANVELCLIEITAACDFAQSKAHNARLIFGLLVKAIAAAGKKELGVPDHCRTFAREVEFVRINEPDRGIDGDYRLMLNARWLHSCPVSELAKQRPIIRLRDQVITDIRAWFASHASRPGYVSLH
jgi:hypothetical protein